MKLPSFVIAFTAILSFGILASCTSSADEVEKSQQDVVEANKALDEAQKAYQEDIVKYRKNAADKIETHNQSIAEFKGRVKADKKEAKKDYLNKIAALEQKNTDLKKNLDDYKESGKENWEQFKIDFSRSMDLLEVEIKSIGDK